MTKDTPPLAPLSKGGGVGRGLKLGAFILGYAPCSQLALYNYMWQGHVQTVGRHTWSPG